MKLIHYVFFIIVLFCNISCSIVIRTTSSSTLDLKKYAENNFFIIEGTNISEAYIPLGIVTATVESGYAKPAVSKISNDNIYGERIEYKKRKLEYTQATLEEAIELLYQEALKSKANAIINLKYDYVPSLNNQRDKWVVSGLAIEIQN